MSTFSIRSFCRTDRDQVAGLVNFHAGAVVPGSSVSVNAVLAQFEREPGEFIVDPWVAERHVLVAEQNNAIVAATLLLRYRDEPEVGESMRNAGEIRWLLFTPIAPTGNPHRSDGGAAAEGLALAALEQFRDWGVEQISADGALPTPGVYGVPAEWPHVALLFERVGFRHTGTTEIVLLAELTTLLDPARSAPRVPSLTTRRSVGINGTRFTGQIDGKEVGYIEVEVRDAGRISAGDLADIGNLHIADGVNYRETAHDLIAHAARWLRLGGVGRVMAYARIEDEPELALLHEAGFTELTHVAAAGGPDKVTDHRTAWVWPLEVSAEYETSHRDRQVARRPATTHGRANTSKPAAQRSTTTHSSCTPAASEGVHRFFNAVPGHHKRLTFWEGGHDDWPSEMHELSIGFVIQHSRTA